MILGFMAQLQNVLYIGILAMPSKIYIVINYMSLNHPLCPNLTTRCQEFELKLPAHFWKLSLDGFLFSVSFQMIILLPEYTYMW